MARSQMPLRTATYAVRTIFRQWKFGKTIEKQGDSYEIIVRTNLCDRSINHLSYIHYSRVVFALFPSTNYYQLLEHTLFFSSNLQSLEDLCSHYDQTVRNSMSDIIQFKYGDDGLDPAAMEGKGKQVDLPRVLQHVQVYYIVNCPFGPPSVCLLPN